MLTELLNHTALEVLNHTINATASMAVAWEETVSLGAIFGIAFFGIVSTTALIVGVCHWIKPDELAKLESQLVEVKAEVQTQLHRLEQSRKRSENIAQSLSYDMAKQNSLDQEYERLNQVRIKIMSQLEQKHSPDGANTSSRLTMFGTLSSCSLPNEHSIKSRKQDRIVLSPIHTDTLRSITGSPAVLFQSEYRPTRAQALVSPRQLTYAEKHTEVDTAIELAIGEVDESQAEVALFIGSLPEQHMLTQRVSL